MAGNSHFPNTDWRFNEFPNPSAHALYVSCVELMTLPQPPQPVAAALLDVINKVCRLRRHLYRHYCATTLSGERK